MDNVFKKSIRERSNSTTKRKEKVVNLTVYFLQILAVQTEKKTKSKAQQTKRKLSNLLEKIRKKSCIRSSYKSSNKKMKKLQAKYECFDPISKI